MREEADALIGSKSSIDRYLPMLFITADEVLHYHPIADTANQRTRMRS